jgi:glycosyltransferase involved in cell wall biosynthesis
MTLYLGCVTISFNQGRFLRDCIDSTTCADRSRLAHVIVDPGSSDGSREIIGEYAMRQRFHATILEPDRGPGDGLNKGFARLAHADILGYINSDDRYEPGALDKVLEYFQRHPQVDVLIGSGAIIDDSGRRQLRKCLSTPFTARRFLHGTMMAVQQATFFRRAAFAASGGFNPENRTSWDTELLIDMLLAGARFRGTNRVLGHFRVYPGTITSEISRNGPGERYLADQARLRQKLIAAGHRPAPAPLPALAYWSYRLNPWRRVMEFLVA